MQVTNCGNINLIREVFLRSNRLWVFSECLEIKLLTMKFSNTRLGGCYVINTDVHCDLRGRFTKCYNEAEFIKKGINFTLKEQFFTISHKNVLRGMHFQLPPHGHCKLVSCFSGAILDVLLDLRKDSSTYGKSESLELTANDGKTLFIPEGIAHGFLSLQDNSGLLYNTSAEYAPDHDIGIRWDSFEYNWPVKKPIISIRDDNQPLFYEIESPF